MGYTDPDVVMIVLAAFIALFIVGSLGTLFSLRRRAGMVVLTFVLHLIILSLGIGYGGDRDRTLFISYMCWSWTYLATSTQSRDLVHSSAQGLAGQGIGGAWWLAILGTAIASAAYNTHDPMDNRALCIFGLVTTVLMYIPIVPGVQASFRDG